MVIHLQLEIVVVTEIYFSDLTALLTIIRRDKSRFFIFWRCGSGVILSNLYKSG
jgi:hypothetical protein